MVSSNLRGVKKGKQISSRDTACEKLKKMEERDIFED